MKKVNLVALVIILFSFNTPLVWPGSGDYGLPGEYLNYDVGARAAGMGGAMTGLADDVSAAHYNPAGLARQNPVTLGMEHVQLFEDTVFDFVACNLPLDGIGYLGVGAVLLSSFGYDLRDEDYQPLAGSNQTWQGALLATYARDLSPDVQIGTNLKVVHEKLFDRQDSSIGLDLGVLYSPIKQFQIGFMAVNALPPSIMEQTFVPTFKLGLAGLLFDRHVLIDADISQALGNHDPHWKIGTEVMVYGDAVFVRAGLDDETRIAVGAGTKISQFSIDYAAGIEALGWSHKLSLGYTFGGYQVSLQAQPRIFSPAGIKRYTTLTLQAHTKYPIEHWEVTITDGQGDAVRSFQGEEQPPNQLVWHGKDDRGLLVHDGKFVARLSMVDIHGGTMQADTGAIEVRNQVPLTADETLSLE